MPVITYFGTSDRGLKRSNNEDSFVVKPDLGFAVVADGMGGPAFGEVASDIFTRTAADIFSGTDGMDEGNISEIVQNIFQLSNEIIFRTAEKNPRQHGMGCTAELLAFYNQSYIVGHVGDSRTYLFRDGKLKQITQDHSVVQDQLDKGMITQVEARNHALKHVILRAVGVKESLVVDLIQGKTIAGDLFLLCSDGLTDMVDNTAIRDVLLLSLGISEKGEKLIELAKSAGGNDNVTVALCEVMTA